MSIVYSPVSKRHLTGNHKKKCSNNNCVENVKNIENHNKLVQNISGLQIYPNTAQRSKSESPREGRNSKAAEISECSLLLIYKRRNNFLHHPTSEVITETAETVISTICSSRTKKLKIDLTMAQEKEEGKSNKEKKQVRKRTGKKRRQQKKKRKA